MLGEQTAHIVHTRSNATTQFQLSTNLVVEAPVGGVEEAFVRNVLLGEGVKRDQQTPGCNELLLPAKPQIRAVSPLP